MSDRPSKAAMSRRRFVTLVAAGSASLLAAGPARGAARRSAAAKPAARAMSPATRRELERQRKSTRETLAKIRGHAMPPGTELGFVFRARQRARREG